MVDPKTQQNLILKLNRLREQAGYIFTPYRQLLEDFDSFQNSLISYIQELQAENEQLKKENEALDTQVRNLQKGVETRLKKEEVKKDD
jgi:cell division protein FtsB